MSGHRQIKRVTLFDVAQASGVSYQTVSRVINEHPSVSKTTRQRVLKAIKELDYRPNHAAQSLVTRRSYTLEIITYGSNFYGPSRMVASVERAARALGYHLTFSNLADTKPEDFHAALDTVGNRLLDGMLVIFPTVGMSYPELLSMCRGVPLVLVDNELGAHTPSVLIDQRYGGQMLAEHLIRTGNHQIVEISGPKNWHGARARHEGLDMTLRAAGISLIAAVEGDWTPVGGYKLAHQLVNDGANFTALVAGNDHMALGAMRALRERGLRVPEDVSVVGFDNLPESAYYEPPLTTVYQDFDELGKQSVDYLMALIEQPDMAVHQRILYPHFLERLSTQSRA